MSILKNNHLHSPIVLLGGVKQGLIFGIIEETNWLNIEETNQKSFTQKVLLTFMVRNYHQKSTYL